MQIYTLWDLGLQGMGGNMLKKDLLEKLKDIAEDADVDEAIKAMDEYKATVDYSKLTTDEYKKILEENPVIKAYQQSSFDSAVGSAVTKHDQKFMKEKLPGLIEEEIKKRNNKDCALHKLNIYSKMMNKYSKVLADKKLPAELVDYVVGKDEETSNKNVEFFNGLIGKLTEQNLKDNAAKPPKGDAGKVDNDTQMLMNAMGLSADDSAANN